MFPLVTNYKSGRKGFYRRVFFTIIVLISAILVSKTVSIYGQSAGSSPTERYIELHARQWAFEPNVIEVNQGDTVIINLVSDDVSHGFYLEGYNLEAKVVLEEGAPNSATVEFVADKPGVYTFRCTVNCGPFHPFMTGKLVVNPPTPFYGGMSLSVIALAVFVIVFFIWRW